MAVLPEAAETVVTRFLASSGAPGTPVVRDALAYWRGQPARPGRPARRLRTDTPALVTHVTGRPGTPIPDEERG